MTATVLTQHYRECPSETVTIVSQRVRVLEIFSLLPRKRQNPEIKCYLGFIIVPRLCSNTASATLPGPKKKKKKHLSEMSAHLCTPPCEDYRQNGELQLQVNQLRSDL